MPSKMLLMSLKAEMPLVIALLLLLLLATHLPPSASGASTAASSRIPPALPTQFRADVSITSHLTDPRQKYPPSVRLMKVQYDFQQQLAKAEMVHGYEANKTYVRRYDQKREYMVKHGQYKKCERAYLGNECVSRLVQWENTPFFPHKGSWDVRMCILSYLVFPGETMPTPEIPFSQEFLVMQGFVAVQLVAILTEYFVRASRA